jgi:hypothetical protein
LTNKNTNREDNDDDITKEAPELDEVFNKFQLEEECWKGQYADTERKFPYQSWENFKAKCIDPKSGKWYTSGEGTGVCKGKEGPKRVVTSIIRLKADNGTEYLLSNSTITGYNQSGDPVFTDASLPEKYNKTIFRFETVPNHETGYATRLNVGPSGFELIYTLPFTKENVQRLFDMRDGNKIQFMVKDEIQGKVIGIKSQNTVEDTFKLWSESDFTYLYNANYLSKEEKLMGIRAAQEDRLIPSMSDDEINASIRAQESMSQKDKMVSYG